MTELLEEMKSHSLSYVYFHKRTFKVELSSGEEVQATTPELLATILKAIRKSEDAKK